MFAQTPAHGRVRRSGPTILTINGGSSSIKFSVYRTNGSLQRGLSGKLERIGLSGTRLSFNDTGNDKQQKVAATNYQQAVDFLMRWLDSQDLDVSLTAIGHRIVHGMQHSQPELITTKLLDELYRISPYAPEHLPGEIKLIEEFRKHYPTIPQVCCFDTAFHRTIPRIARLIPIPLRYAAKGVERYGFHGLSYAYLMEELVRIKDPATSKGRIILAHLGNGASMAAIRDGKCIDTSMGFTPAAGLLMSTRSGDLDPGLVSYLSRTENMSSIQFDHMVNHESGLLGLSETSSDMRDLLEKEPTDVRAAEAISLFCYQAKKWIGSFAAALGGLDTLVFAGGIGEYSPVIRTRICEGLTFLEIELDEKRNEECSPRISTAASRVAVRVIHTDEESMIAKSVCNLLKI